jgi:phosphoenolpyruvate-protein phosphotransferase
MARATLAGRAGSAGVGWGRLLWLPPTTSSHAATGAHAPAPIVSGQARRDPAAERERLLAALEAAADELTALAGETAGRAGEEIGAIFEAQALFARDPGIVEPALVLVEAGAPAAEAIDRAAAEQADKLAGVDDDYFRERAADVRDVARRVVDRLEGRARPALHHRDGTPAVLASDDLDPSLVAVLRPELVSGIALAGGAPNGHAAIVARALGIPLVLGLGGALEPTLDGLAVAADGTTGRLLVEPTDEEIAALTPAPVEGLSATASVAPPGRPEPSDLAVTILANIGSVREAEAAAAAGAEGIGLVRTELLFLGRSVAPGLDEQRVVYRRIARAAAGRPVVFRTLDIGGDKPASWLSGEPEMNPALGVRGLRLGLRQTSLFETQLRALLEADPANPLRILLPMVAAVEEVAAARRAIEAASATSIRAGAAIATDVRLGIMVEIPSAAVVADAFAPIVDFFSIGTNDLVQYTLAADRTNDALADLATPLQPAILRLVKLVADAALPFGRPVAVCGEAAADPATAAILVGLGVEELSVAPASIARIRSALAGLDLDACREAAGRALDAASVSDVRRIATGLVAREAVIAGSPAA